VFSATIFKIPLQAVFSFSDINSNFGLNNYFRITFDYNKYINDSKLKYAEKTSLYSASSYVSELTNKETREAIKLQSIKFSPSFINKISAEKDSLMLLKSVWNDDIAIDSLNLLSLKNKIISLENINSRCVAIQNTLNDAERKKNDVLFLKAKADSLSQSIESLGGKIPNDLAFSSSFLKNLQFFKKLEIGLVYPNYSTFTLNGTPINGFNTEFQKGSFYSAFSYGTTAFNPLQVYPSLDQPFGLRNLYNYFDFSPATINRKLLSVKIGKGHRESEHIFIGLLYGSGASSTAIVSETNSIPQQSKNLVWELDYRHQIGKSNFLELIYGNSYLQTATTFADSQWINFKQIAPFYQSNAALIRWNGVISLLKTKWSITGRYVDPFFKSLGLGFIRSDHVRGEFRLEQFITNKINFAGFYRRDQDNLLNLLPYSVVLHTYGVTLTWKPKSNTIIKWNFNPVAQNINSTDSFFSRHNQNYILATSASHFAKKSNQQIRMISLVYSFYNLGNNGMGYNIHNANLNTVISLRKIGSLTISGNCFINSVSTSQRIVFAELNYSYSIKSKVIYNMAFRSTNSLSNGFKYGYLASALYRYNRWLSIELKAEKLLISNFYSLFNQSLINRFPYSGNIRIICQF
jgi:hypothetical protein